ncbi:MAG: hypothetical protein ACLPX9_11180 [Rhodomicrobium sp.]
MKRTLTAAAALSLAMAASASAATTTPPSIWQGDMFIATLATSASASGPCTGVNLGYLGQAIYAPANVGSNGVTDQLAIFEPKNGPKGGGHQVQPTPPATTLNGATSFDWLHIDFQAGATPSAGVTGQTFTITPSSISATTQTVNISISMLNYNPTCDVTLQGALALRPGTLPN